MREKVSKNKSSAHLWSIYFHIMISAKLCYEVSSSVLARFFQYNYVFRLRPCHLYGSWHLGDCWLKSFVIFCMLVTWPFSLINMVAHRTCGRWTRWVCSNLEASSSSFLGYHLALLWVLVPVIMACSQLSQIFILGIVFLFSFSQSYLSLGSYWLVLSFPNSSFPVLFSYSHFLSPIYLSGPIFLSHYYLYFSVLDFLQLLIYFFSFAQFIFVSLFIYESLSQVYLQCYFISLFISLTIFLHLFYSLSSLIFFQSSLLSFPSSFLQFLSVHKSFLQLSSSFTQLLLILSCWELFYGRLI
jgi:hypothetical protein